MAVKISKMGRKNVRGGEDILYTIKPLVVRFNDSISISILLGRFPYFRYFLSLFDLVSYGSLVKNYPWLFQKFA